MLREYRKAHGIKQKDLAKSLGVSNPYLCDIEKGKRTPGLALAVRIEDATKGAVPATSWIKRESAA